MAKLKNFLGLYRHANQHRRTLTSLKWRAFAVLLLISFMLVIKEYLTQKYLAEFAENPLAYLILDKVYYWFIAGTIIGIAFSWLLYEGEFVIGVWKLTKSIEHNAMKGMAKIVGARKTKKKKR